jgi:hypothetical protein
MQRRFPERPGQLNASLNRNFFGLDLKTATDELDKTVAGTKFNITGAATRNALLPISVYKRDRSVMGWLTNAKKSHGRVAITTVATNTKAMRLFAL